MMKLWSSRTYVGVVTLLVPILRLIDVGYAADSISLQWIFCERLG
jgi:hypothetical protein